MVYIICLFIGMLTAFGGSLAGLGGGIILIPCLLFLHQFSSDFAWATPQTIVGISLVVMVITALSSTIAYLKKGRVDKKAGLLLLTGSIPGGIVGSWLNQFIEAEKFSLYFGVLMIVLSLLFLIKRKATPPTVSSNQKHIRKFQVDGETYYYSIPIIYAFIISLLVGTLSGLFGIGGGSIMVPLMILLFGFPAHIAIATSMFMIFFISIISAGMHIALGHVAWEYALFFIPGAWIGGKLGARLNQHLKGNVLEWVLRLLLVCAGLRLIVEGLS